MRPPSVSSEDIDFESVEFEELRSKPMPQASPPDPNQAPPALSPIMSNSPASEMKGNEKERPLEAIDSFLPILQFLPGLVLIEGTYHHRGAVSQADLQKLCAYTQRIGKFTLTDNVKGREYRIHHGTLLRIVQLHNSVTSRPLFPSLNCLRIVDAQQSSFDHLNLFLTRSLRSLEVINIPEAQKLALSVFLDAIVDEAPDLTRITLGLGCIPDNLLQACSKFNHLSRLELTDVVSSFNFAFLENIGNLQALKDFVLHAENSRYDLKQPESSPNGVLDTLNACPPEKWDRPKSPDRGFPGVPASPPAGSRPPSPVPSIRSQSPMADQIPETASPFSNPTHDTVDSSQITEPPEGSVKRYFPLLKKLHVIGSLALIEDLIGLVASEEIVDLALTLVGSPSPPITETKKINKTKGPGKSATPIAPPVIQPQVIPFATVVELAHRKWFEALTAIRIGRKGEITGTANSTATSGVVGPVLPAITFELLLLHHTLKCLDISGWTLTSISETLQSLAAKPPSKLEILHLPIDNTSPGISLTRLREIAEACPRLVSLRCNIKHLSNIPEYPSGMPAVNALSHGLEVLSVGNASPHPDSQRPLLIARHLNVIFPNLKRIETHPGYNAEQWKYTGDLVELCQNARLDDTRRPPSCKRTDKN